MNKARKIIILTALTFIAFTFSCCNLSDKQNAAKSKPQKASESQNNAHAEQKICKDIVKKLYEKIFEDKMESFQTGYRVYSCKALCFNKSKEDIFEAIDKGKVSTSLCYENTSELSTSIDKHKIVFYVSTIPNDPEPILEIFCWDDMPIIQSTCKDCVRIFYEKVFHNKADSVSIGFINCSRKSLLPSKNEEDIYAAIKNARTFSYGHPLDSVVALTVGKQTLYFRISTERPDSNPILDVYDSNCKNLSCDNDFLLMPCVLKSDSNFIYVRKEKDASSKPVAKILKNQIFFFTPCQDSDWYKVSLIYGQKYVGYIHKSNILPYEKCSKRIRKKMEHLLFC